jgi:hypothetical protein
MLQTILVRFLIIYFRNIVSFNRLKYLFNVKLASIEIDLAFLPVYSLNALKFLEDYCLQTAETYLPLSQLYSS